MNIVLEGIRNCNDLGNHIPNNISGINDDSNLTIIKAFQDTNNSIILNEKQKSNNENRSINAQDDSFYCNNLKSIKTIQKWIHHYYLRKHNDLNKMKILPKESENNSPISEPIPNTNPLPFPYKHPLEFSKFQKENNIMASNITNKENIGSIES